GRPVPPPLRDPPGRAATARIRRRRRSGPLPLGLAAPAGRQLSERRQRGGIRAQAPPGFGAATGCVPVAGLGYLRVERARPEVTATGARGRPGDARRLARRARRGRAAVLRLVVVAERLLRPEDLVLQPLPGLATRERVEEQPERDADDQERRVAGGVVL